MGSAVLGRLACELVGVDYCIASSAPAFFGRKYPALSVRLSNHVTISKILYHCEGKRGESMKHYLSLLTSIKTCHLDIKNKLLRSCTSLSTGVERTHEQITLAALRTYRKSEVRLLPDLRLSSLISFHRSSSLLLHRRISIVIAIAMELAAAPQIISCRPLFAC